MPKIREYSFLTPRHFAYPEYVAICIMAGVDPIPNGYGCFHAVDENGNRGTLLIDDVEYVETIVELAQSNPEAIAATNVPAEKITHVVQGWPDDWAGMRIRERFEYAWNGGDDA